MEILESQLAASVSKYHHEQTAAGIKDVIYDNLTEMGYPQEIASDVAETAAKRFLELTA